MNKTSLDSLLCNVLHLNALTPVTSTGHAHKEYFELCSADDFHLYDADGYELLAR